MARQAMNKKQEKKPEPQRRRTPSMNVAPAPKTTGRIIDDTTKRDIAGVCFIVVAVVCMIIVIMPQEGALVSNFASEWLHLSLGIGCYILPILLAGVGVTFLFRSAQQRVPVRAAIGLAIIFIAILGFIALFTPITVLGNDDTSLLFFESMLVSYGGYIGAGIAWVGITCLGRMVTGVVLVGIMIVGILIVGFSISGTIDAVKRKKHELSQRFSAGSSQRMSPFRFKKGSDTGGLERAQMRRGNSFDYELDDLPSRPTNITRPLIGKNADKPSESPYATGHGRTYGDGSRMPGPFVSPYKIHEEMADRTSIVPEGKTIPIIGAPAESVRTQALDIEDDHEPFELEDANAADPEGIDLIEREKGVDEVEVDRMAESVPQTLRPRIPSGFIPIESLRIESNEEDEQDMSYLRLPVIGNAALSIPHSNGAAKDTGSEETSNQSGSLTKTPTDSFEMDDMDIDEAPTPRTVIPKKPYVVLDDILPSVNARSEVVDAHKDARIDIPKITVEDDAYLDLDEIDDIDEPKASSSAKPSKRSSTASSVSTKSKVLSDGGSYKLPSFALLQASSRKEASKANDSELADTAALLQETLSEFGINADVVGWIAGPTVTLFKVDLPAGVRVSRITALNDDLALALAAPGVRIFAPIPGTNYVGIEVPNAERQNVYLADVIKDAPDGPLQIAIGKDVEGNAIVSDLAKMPHLLIGGTTGSGKSVSINAMIMSILMRATPDEVRFIMIDPKRVEFTPYNGIPHLYVPVVTEPKEAASALSWGVAEMERRLKVFSNYGARNITQYNTKVEKGQIVDSNGNVEDEKLPYIVIIIDELADLMMNVGKEVEFSISRIAQLARAAGIHLIVATQRPSTNVVTGLIKANITNRIAFNVASGIDSRVILDTPGAENLIGLGDLLLSKPELAKPQRIQGCFISEDEINAVVDVVKAQSEPVYHSEILSTNVMSLGDTSPSGGSSGDDDPLLWDAADIVVASKMGSTSNIQRRLKVGYARAGRIMDQLEEHGVVGAANGTKPREVLVDAEELETLKAFELSDNNGF